MLRFISGMKKINYKWQINIKINFLIICYIFQIPIFQYNMCIIKITLLSLFMELNKSNTSSNRAHSIKTTSKVLLVCVYDTVIIQLTNDMVYNTFSPYATIQKILIFQRGQVTKCFVQFSKSEQTEIIKNTLDGTKIANTFCKMHIFYSNLPQVDLKNKKTRGKDYSSSSGGKYYQNQINSPKKKIQRKTSDDFEIENHKDEQFQLAKYKSKTDGYQLSKVISDMRKLQPFFQDQSKLDQRIRWDIQNIIEQTEQSFIENFEKKITQNMNKDSRGNVVSEIINQKQKVSEVLYFNYETKITVLETYNLFSNFGNIQKIFIKNFVVYIQFTTVQFALVAKQYLNNTVFYGNVLRMNFGDKSQLIERPKQYSQSIVFDESFQRFNSTRSISINPPSQTLHISNLKKQYCNMDKIKGLFYHLAKVEKVSFFAQNKERNMALVKFFTLEDSFKVISSMHNTIVSGRKIQISFTKSKIP